MIDPIVLDISGIDGEIVGTEVDGKRIKVDLDRQLLQPLCKTGRVFCYDSPEYVKDMGTPDRYIGVCEDYVAARVQAKNLMNQQKAIFLDRDGTINKYVGFLKDIDQFVLLPGTAEAIKKINQSGYLAIVVTNQPVVARGEVTISELQTIHNKMETLLGIEGAYVVYYYFIKMKMKSKAVFVVVGGLAVVLFGFDQFSYYYGDNKSARSMLTSVGIKIANNKFPLGAGFASFAASMSNTYYSPLYYTYNLNKVWGLGGGNYYAYISDTFWPIVIGQFGWFGLVVVFLIFWQLIKQSLNIKKDRYGFICSLAVVGFLILFSLGGSSIFNPISILCAMCFSYFSYSSEEVNDEYNVIYKKQQVVK